LCDDDDDVYFVLDQHAELDIYSASSLKQQTVDRHVTPLGHNFRFQAKSKTTLAL
jgi:predicted alpha/beta hydrolase